MTTATNRPNVAGNVGRVGAVIAIAIALCALSAAAQTAKAVKGATPLVAVPNEAPPKLVVDPPIPEQLAQGRVFIQYRTENLRILPVFGNAAVAVSPRLGHLHYYVDDQSWPTVDTSGETVILVGLKPGPHKVKLELADDVDGVSQIFGMNGAVRRPLSHFPQRATAVLEHLIVDQFDFTGRREGCDQAGNAVHDQARLALDSWPGFLR